MVDPFSINEKFIKLQRDRSRVTCLRCNKTFDTPQLLTAHLDRAHKASPVVEPSPSSAIAGGPSGSSAAGEESAKSASHPLSTNDAGQGLPASIARSGTPTRGAAEVAHMQISRLSLEEHDSKLLTSAAEFAKGINRVDTSSPSKKRPASSEAHGPRPSVLRSSQRQNTRRRGDAESPWKQSSMTDDFQRPRPNNDRLYDPNASQSPRSAQKPLHQPRSSQEPIIIDHNMDEGTEPTTEAPQAGKSPPSRTHAPRGLIQVLGPSMQKALKPVHHKPLEQISNNISRDQLLAELKGLYRSLEIVEKRCISLDQTHMSDRGRLTKPTTEDWQVLSALHRTLLYEHHDFLLATQHPAAPEEIRRLAAERQIPFRMWKYAIHAFLELLRQHLPDSLETLEFMESFIYLAYQMMALLYETVRPFEDVWVECLGDLARYRMAIESQSAGVRDVWAEVAQYWYSKASDNQPSVGRLYHHLGILARPNLPQQLFFYCKALCCVTPFPNARHSIKAVFEAAKQQQDPSYKPSEAFRAVDLPFVRVHVLLYEAQANEQVVTAQREFQEQFKKSLPGPVATFKPEKRWKHYGVILAVTNVAACFGYGAIDNPLRQIVDRASLKDRPPEMKSLDPVTDAIHVAVTRAVQDTWVAAAFDFLSAALCTVTTSHTSGEKTLAPFVHVHLVFLDALSSMVQVGKDITLLLGHLPWDRLAGYLNDVGRSRDAMTDQIRLETTKDQTFLTSEDRDTRPLMEDNAMKGLIWCQDHFPKSWFDKYSDDELPHQEFTSSENMRAQRMLRLGIKIALRTDLMTFDRASGLFATDQIPAQAVP